MTKMLDIVDDEYQIVLRSVNDPSKEKVIGRINHEDSLNFNDHFRHMYISKDSGINSRLVEWCRRYDIHDKTVIDGICSVFSSCFLSMDDLDEFFRDVEKNQIAISPGDVIDYRKEFNDRFQKYLGPMFIDMFSQLVFESPKIGRYELLAGMFFKDMKKCGGDMSGDLVYREKRIVDVKSGKSNMAGVNHRKTLKDAYATLTRNRISLLRHTNSRKRHGTMGKSQGLNIFEQLKKKRYSDVHLGRVLGAFLIYGMIDVSVVVDKFKTISTFKDFETLVMAMQMIDYVRTEGLHHLLMCNNNRMWLSGNIHEMTFNQVFNECRKHAATDWSWGFHERSKSLRIYLKDK